jgi:hypothetical protein
MATVWVIMFVWVVASALVAMGFVYGVAVGRRHGTKDLPIAADEPTVDSAGLPELLVGPPHTS